MIKRAGVPYPIYIKIYNFLYSTCKGEEKSWYKSLIGVTKMY